MDFELNDDQQAILESVQSLLAQHAGPARNIVLQAKGEYDSALDDALAEAGFCDVARGEDTGPLEAALVCEAVARAGGVVSFSAAALIAPGVTDRLLPGPIALAVLGQPGAVRYLAHARTLLVSDGDEARILVLDAGDQETVRSNLGYPMGRLLVDPAAIRSRTESLGPGSGGRLRDWWRLGLAVEAAGTMRAALETTVEYVKQRRQFGRAIGSFQAVQHRLAECAVEVEASRWLALEAAWKRAPEEMAATAAAYALDAARHVFVETHQLTGAIGYTREHDLHVWSMRLQALRLELEGASGQRRAVARSRWGASA